MKSNKTSASMQISSADIISRKLNVDRNTFIAAVRSAHSDLSNQLNSLIQLEEQFGITEEKTEDKRGRGRPTGSPNKNPKTKTLVKPKATRGRPKGAKNKSAKASPKMKSVKGAGAKRGRKAKSDSGLTMREAVSNVLRNAKTSVSAVEITERLAKQGFNAKSIAVQIAQELSRMVKIGTATRPERGQYVFSGSPEVTSAITVPADAEQAA
jgi:hypothetical protein